MHNETWNIEQAMQYLKVKSRSTVYSYCKYKGLPSIKIGSHRLFDPKDVIEFREKFKQIGYLRG